MAYKYKSEENRKKGVLNLRKGNGNRPMTEEEIFFRSMKRKHQLSQEGWNKLFQSQTGRCAGCGVYQSQLKKRLCLDHCHKTGRIRGLLCSVCNTRLSVIEKYRETYNNLMAYLENSER